MSTHGILWRLCHWGQDGSLFFQAHSCLFHSDRIIARHVADQLSTLSSLPCSYMWPHDEVPKENAGTIDGYHFYSCFLFLKLWPSVRHAEDGCQSHSGQQKMREEIRVSRQPSGVEPKPYLELLQEKGIHFSFLQTTEFFFFSPPCYSSLASLWLTSCISGIWHGAGA